MTLFELLSELTDAIWHQYETDLVDLIIAEQNQPPEPPHDDLDLILDLDLDDDSTMS